MGPVVKSKDPLVSRLDAIEHALLQGRPSDSFARCVELLQYVRKGISRQWTQNAADEQWLAQACDRFCRLYAATVLHPQWDPLREPALPSFLFELQDFFSLVRLSSAGNLDVAITRQAAAFERARTPAGFLRILLLWTPASEAIPTPFEHFDHARAVVTAQALAVIATMIAADARTDRARNEAIALLNSGRVVAGDVAPFIEHAVFGSAWMRCSYASPRDRHSVKKVLNAAIRTVYEPEMDASAADPVPVVLVRDGRPLLVVPVEWAFREGGAMYRCYAPVIRDLRTRFQVVGIGMRDMADDATRSLFDAWHGFEDFSADGKIDIGCVARAIRSLSPVMVFFPSVGMIRTVVCLANLRLAPVQVMTVGHPATSCSDRVDYLVTEAGFVGDPAIFSEKLVTVPDGTLAFDAPPATGTAARRQGPPDDGCLHVAVPAIAHKLSWAFVSTLKQVQAGSSRRVVFHFFSGMQGVHFHEARHELRKALPGCVVYPWMEYQDYLDRVDRCHVHAASFPFGGTNSLIDSLRQGIPVVALRGREVHERIDAEFMRRLGLDDVLVSDTTQGYADILVRLARDPEALDALRRRVRDEIDVAGVLMNAGHPEHFTEALWALLPGDSGA